MKTTRRPCYFLGTVINGNVFAYTALGTFKTVQSAAARCIERKALIFEQFDLGYGLTEPKAVASCVGRVRQ